MESQSIILTEAYPLELHYVKALLLQKQYRQCITACREVLKFSDEKFSKHPLQHTFVQFYLALAHDELARAMHNFSQAKIPAFNQAQQFYLAALTALPTLNDCIASAKESAVESRHDSCHGPESIVKHTSVAPLDTMERPKSFSQARSPPMSPPTHTYNDSLPTRSPPMNSSVSDNSDLDDLESHDSFNEIMTPNRLPKLQRDYSSMSLLQLPPQQTPHGLMRPIRLGSPARPYQIPPRHSYHGHTQQRRSMLPRLNTTPSNSSPVRKQLRTRSEQVSPVEELVSPLGSEGDSIASDASTISPISPETPIGMHIGESSVALQPRPSISPLIEHLQGMRRQLESHIKLLQAAKQQTLVIQAERSAARADPRKSGKLTALIDAAGAKNKHLSLNAGHWSFAPEDIKVLELQKRVEAGRNRGWVKKQFNPERYMELAEVALAEL